jgi:LysM repeat protein
MSDSGLPVAGSAQACPFVAFADDRDERATSPDHRHRCYAEARPAPRALAHQEAYCLASTFPVCPTFQDWARREAAQARGAPADDERSRYDDPARRNPPSDWSAPPPWSAGAPGVVGTASAGGPADAGDEGDDAEDRDYGEGGEDGEARDDDGRGFLAGRSAAAAAGAGLAGSAADRLAGDARDEPDAESFDERAGDRFDDQIEDFDTEPRGRPRSARASGGIGFGRDRRPKVGDTRRAQGWDDAGPSWERQRQNEAYPPLKRRRGMSVSRLGWMAIALVAVAIGLFFLPQLLGLGTAPGQTGDRTPSPQGSSAPSGPAEPTPVPIPTPQIYIVKAGDNMSKIAALFGVTLDELIAANRELHPDPDTLQIGDEVIIPVPGSGGTASPEPSPSA